MSKIFLSDRNKNKPGMPPSWEYKFEIASVNGTRKYSQKAGFASKAEANAAAIRAYNEYNNTGKSFKATELSVSDFLDYWITNYVEINSADSTAVNSISIIKNHIKPRIGHYRLKNVDTLLLQQLINNIYIERGLTKSHLENILKLLKSCFKYAVVTAKVLQYNPAIDVTLPKMAAKPKPRKTLTDDEILKVLERFKKSPCQYYSLIISYYTGLRIAEVYGLTWDCIDLQNQTMTINKICKKIRNENYEDYGTECKAAAKWYLGACKSFSSERTIKIGDTLVKALSEYKALQENNKERFGSRYVVHFLKERTTKSNNKVYQIIPADGTIEEFIPLPKVDLVMVKDNGEFRGIDVMKYPAKVAKYELGIPFNFHKLRHTHATKLIELGAPIKDVQSRLGHSNITTTMNTYVSNTDKMQTESVNLFEKSSKLSV